MAAETDLPRRLRAARVLADVETREDLAQRLSLPGLSAKTLGAIERGERELRPHEIPPIAHALGVPVSFFTDRSLNGADSESQLDRIEAKLDLILASLRLMQPAEDDAPARIVEAVRDAAARAGAVPEPEAQESPPHPAPR